MKNFKQTTRDSLLQIFTAIPSKKSVGVNEIPNKIIKYCKDELIYPLLDILNSSIKQSKVPQKMKIALVYPKHKI